MKHTTHSKATINTRRIHNEKEWSQIRMNEMTSDQPWIESRTKRYTWQDL